MNIAKTVKDGDFVCYRGNKIVRVSSNTKPNKIIGVWQNGYVLKMLLPNDKKITINIPSGIVCEGKTFTKISV
jgi:hypothetical protein